MAEAPAKKLNIFIRDGKPKFWILFKPKKPPTLLELCYPSQEDYFMDSIEKNPFNIYTFTGRWLITNCKYLISKYPPKYDDDDDANFRYYYGYYIKKGEYIDDVNMILEIFYKIFYYFYMFTLFDIQRILDVLENITEQNTLKNELQYINKNLNDSAKKDYVDYLRKKYFYFEPDLGDSLIVDYDGSFCTFRWLYLSASIKGKTVFRAIRYAIHDLVYYTSPRGRGYRHDFIGAKKLAEYAIRMHHRREEYEVDTIFHRDIMFAVLTNLHSPRPANQEEQLDKMNLYTSSSVNNTTTPITYTQYNHNDAGIIQMEPNKKIELQNEFREIKNIITLLRDKHDPITRSINNESRPLWRTPHYYTKKEYDLLPPSLVIASGEFPLDKMIMTTVELGKEAAAAVGDIASSLFAEGGKEQQGLSKMTLSELKTKAKQKNLKGYSKLNKAELIKLLQKHNNKRRQIK